MAPVERIGRIRRQTAECDLCLGRGHRLGPDRHLARGQRFDPYDPHPAVQRQFQDLALIAIERNAVPLAHDVAGGVTGAGTVVAAHPVRAGDGQGKYAIGIGDGAPFVAGRAARR